MPCHNIAYVMTVECGWVVGFVYYSLHVVDRLHQNINDKLVNPTTLDILNLDESYSSIAQDNFISLQTVCLLRKTP